MKDVKERTLGDVLNTHVARIIGVTVAMTVLAFTAIITNAVASFNKTLYDEHPVYWSGIWTGGLVSREVVSASFFLHLP